MSSLLSTVVQTKSVVVITGIVVGAYAIVRIRQRVTAATEIGPYPVEEKNCLLRGLQRHLNDWTRKDVSFEWFPLENLSSIKPGRINDNGHAVSGGVRDSARELITLAVNSVGGKKYELSPAKQSRPEAYLGVHYAPSDLHYALSLTQPDEKSIIVGVDIDYYVREPELLLGHALPAIFHTFNPVNVAGRDGDSTFRIVDNCVTYDVSGGGAWKHEVWDWCAFGEFVETRTRRVGLWATLANLFGVRQVVYHKIHHSRPWTNCPDRALVWCLPTYTMWKIDWIGCDMHARGLKRVVYKDKTRPGWNAVVSQDQDAALQISIGREGDDLSRRYPKEDFDLLMGLSTAQSLTTRMLGMKYTCEVERTLLAQYYTGKVLEIVERSRLGRPIQPNVHWPAVCHADVAEVSSREYAAPLVSDVNLMPMIKRWEVLSASLERRVTWVANTKEPAKYMQQYAVEFVQMVVGDATRGYPYTLEETREQLNKSSQILAVNQVWETIDAPARRMIEAFVKNEPGNKSARIISSFADMRFLLCFSAYTLKFRDEVLHAEHNQHWFCPGLTPLQIAQRVQDYSSEVAQVIEGDFSNFDGTVSAWCQRNVMNAVYHRHFARPVQEELQKYTSMLVSCPARAKRFGFKYEAGVGVKSGSPTTCDLNTVLNAFIQYVAVRRTRKELGPKDCFSLIGLAFGDDSLFDAQFSKQFTMAATNLGMQLKVEVCTPETGVTFLARVFPEPRDTLTSFQDPLRTWRKLHLTARHPDIPIASAATDRVGGYLITDALTPVTGDYCRMVERCYKQGVECAEVRSSRTSVNFEKPYWSLTGGSWPQHTRDIPLMRTVISARTGVSYEDLTALEATLNACADVWANFTINRDFEPNPYTDTVDVDGIVGVDDRKYQDEKDVTINRANHEPARVPQGDNVTRSRADLKPKTSRRQNQEGPRQLPQLLHQDASQASGSNRKPPVKAPRGPGPQRPRPIAPLSGGAGGRPGESVAATGSRGAPKDRAETPALSVGKQKRK
nr:RNA-dependent RNA polymerase [Nodaviridae sp.]